MYHYLLFHLYFPNTFPLPPTTQKTVPFSLQLLEHGQVFEYRCRMDTITSKSWATCVAIQVRLCIQVNMRLGATAAALTVTSGLVLNFCSSIRPFDVELLAVAFAFFYWINLISEAK